MRVRVITVGRQRQRIVFGVFVILVGLFALLDNLNLFDARLVQPYWPLVFVAVGGLKLNQARDSTGWNGLLIGAAFIGVGIAMTLHNLGFIHFRVRDWWPLFVIFGGVLMITRGARSRGEVEPDTDINRAFGPGDRPEEREARRAARRARFGRSEQVQHGDRIETSAVLSGSVLKNDTQDFRGGEINAIMGGVELDLRQASIQSEAVLHVFAMWGGIEIKVPEDWSVIVTGMPILGGIEDKTVPPRNSTKRLVVEGLVVMGGVEIRN